MRMSVAVDGVRYDDEVEPRLLLVHYLREQAGRTGTPVGCDTTNCGACTVLLNGSGAVFCAVPTAGAHRGPRSPPFSGGAGGSSPRGQYGTRLPGEANLRERDPHGHRA
jgi:hypothetical protein